MIVVKLLEILASAEDIQVMITLMQLCMHASRLTG